jgi:hypothetical protein
MQRTFSFCIMLTVATLIGICAYFIVAGFYTSSYSNQSLLGSSGAAAYLSTTTEKSGVWLWSVDSGLESTIYTQSARMAERFNTILLALR